MKECFGVGYMEIPIGKFSIISTETKRSETMKQILILTCMIALVFPLALSGCCRTEIANLKKELEKTESEKGNLQAQVNTVTQTRDQLQKQVSI